MVVLYIPGLAYAKVRSETRIVLALIHVFIGIYMLLFSILYTLDTTSHPYRPAR